MYWFNFPTCHVGLTEFWPQLLKKQVKSRIFQLGYEYVYVPLIVLLQMKNTWLNFIMCDRFISVKHFFVKFLYRSVEANWGSESWNVLECRQKFSFFMLRRVRLFQDECCKFVSITIICPPQPLISITLMTNLNFSLLFFRLQNSGFLKIPSFYLQNFVTKEFITWRSK